ncbi:MAG: type II toxin-antitoxin system death-on-curing family toxin [Alistipes sp.]|nr:type II toxin-antitoxin system death-on-curing family toxin [Alistipes sp.]
MKKLTKKQIIMLHEMLIAESGGSPEIRDEGLLDSAINTPFQSFGGSELYPTLLEKAARLGFGLIKNHPFVDGNKRIGTHTMLVFLELNHQELKYTDEELIELILGVAASKYDEKHLLLWLQQHLA